MSRMRRAALGHRRWPVAVILLTAAFVVAVVVRLLATNDENHIQEILAGANGNSRIQFIVIKQEGGGNLWGPQFGETQSRVMLQFFDVAGRETGRYKFAHDVPLDSSPQLIATQEFANLPGAPAPDFIMPPLVNPMGGKVCFTNNPQNGNAFPRTDCVSYGSFTGSTGSDSGGCNGTVVDGAPAPALPITGTQSLKRTDPVTTCGSVPNSHFVINATPTPVNDAGATFTLPASTQVAQGENLFTNETFGGNGRTCASCHVASLSMRFTPANAQSRFGDLTNTFDPQFIGENAPSAFDAGFDFNLNTLVLTAAVTGPAATCTGTFSGILTSGGGAKAKVVTQISSTRYLVYGGRSPALSGTISDSHSCSATFSSITAGGLGTVPGSGVLGLEDPQRMRTSADTVNFPQGRALILENIDGFPPTAPVFRKSPHLLNLNRTAPYGFGGDIPDLQTFATGAVRQHLPRSLSRASSGSSPDFRLPTAAELAAMEAFMQSLEFPPGSDPNKFDLNRFATTAAAQRGRTAFFGTAKCSQCHGGTVLAQTTVPILDQASGINGVFNTGVVTQLINSSGVDKLPCENDPVIATCGSRKFSVPQLFNVKHLGPYFHDASAATLTDAVSFYNSSFFNASPAGVAIGGITLSPGDIGDIVAFLDSLVIPKISPNSSTTLTGTAGTAASPAPSVLVTDDDGNPLAGVTVTFAITAGAGSVTGATQVTNASGVATIGGWTLGAGGSTLTATASDASGSIFENNPIAFAATGIAVTNDNFANRFTLTGSAVTTTGSNTGFTSEAGEPNDLLSNSGSTPSAWWTWTAPCSFSRTSPTSFIDTIGSSFDTVLGVFTGSSLGALTRFASDDDAGGSLTSRVPSGSPGPTTLTITAGTVFQIRVRGFGVASTGSIVLHINTPCATPAPTVTNVSPSIGPATGGTVVTITGNNFVTGAAVSAGGTALTGVSVVDAATITGTMPAHAAGTVNVVVTNPNTQTSTLANGFTFTVPPTITSVVPAAGPAAGGTAVTISGTGFITGAGVVVGGVAATGVTVVNSTTIAATTAAHATGPVAVVVTNTDSLSGTKSSGFTYTGHSVKASIAGARSSFTLNGSADDYWLSIEAVGGRSYCALRAASATAQTTATVTLTALRGDAATSLATSAGVTPMNCFIAPATETVYVKTTQSDHSRRPHLILVNETTLWANWFFIGGSYSSYSLLRNTTDADVHAVITWRSDTGAQAGTETITIPGHGVVFRNARDKVGGGTTAGSIEIAHDGEPEALVGSQTTLSAVTGLSFDTLTFQRRPQ